MFLITEPTCDDAFQLNSRCYKVHKNERVSWFTAFKRCLSYNASLAVFGSDAVVLFPSTLLYERAWIGMKSLWTWPGNKALVFS